MTGLKNIEAIFYRNSSIDFNTRVLPILPAVDDDGVFHIFKIVDYNILVLKNGKPVEAIYFAKRSINAEDLNFSFVDLLIKQTYLQGLETTIEAIINDIHNLGASLRKIEMYYKYYLENKDSVSISRFVTTELEYIVLTCRSLYDLFQKIAAKLWEKLILDTKKRKQIPESFASIVYKDKGKKEFYSVIELVERFGMPEVWARFYHDFSESFGNVRNCRDNVVHRGFSFEYIFCTDKGFAVNFENKVFSSLGVWDQKTFLKNNLAPLKPILAKLILDTLSMMENYADIFRGTIALPLDVAPNYNIYIAGKNIHKINELRSYFVENCWYGE